MFNHDLVHNLQAATIALGFFVSFWGVIEFGKCLIEVLTGKHNEATYSPCPGYATLCMICLAGIVFCFARANTIGLIVVGDHFSGLAFIGGMIIFAFVIALAVWAKAKTRNLERPHPIHVPNLSWIFSMMLIIVMAFILVGLVGAAYK
jgi:uncharacterized membrane protein YidH (DUF202 family)